MGGRRKIGLIFLTLSMTVSGVYATWQYSERAPQSNSTNFGVQMNEIVFAPKETLQITNVQLLSANNAHNVSAHFTHPTYVTTTISCDSPNGSVTYKVTVWNNTNVTYWYLGPSWTKNFESNALIGVSNGISITTKDNSDDRGQTFDEADWVPPYTERDFYVTYSFGANALGSYISTLLSFDFGVKMDAVHDEFSELLNDKVSEFGYHYISQIFNEKYAEDGTTVIANVGEDEEIFNNLFGGELTINVDGEEVPVTIMIQRDNVDNRDTGDNYTGANAPSGCEYTIYITSDALTSATGEAVVYAISYSNGGVGGEGDTWYQLGELYEGTAPTMVYDNEGNLVFDITEWKASAKEYEFVDGKTYKVGYEQGDQYDKMKTLEEIMSANDQDVYNDIDNSQILRKVYAVVHSSSNYNRPGYEGLRTAFENAAPFYEIMNNGQEVKIRRQATRAELLPYIIAIQHAYDYYNQVNGLAQ